MKQGIEFPRGVPPVRGSRKCACRVQFVVSIAGAGRACRNTLDECVSVNPD